VTIQIVGNVKMRNHPSMLSFARVKMSCPSSINSPFVKKTGCSLRETLQSFQLKYPSRFVTGLTGFRNSYAGGSIAAFIPHWMSRNLPCAITYMERILPSPLPQIDSVGILFAYNGTGDNWNKKEGLKELGVYFLDPIQDVQEDDENVQIHLPLLERKFQVMDGHHFAGTVAHMVPDTKCYSPTRHNDLPFHKRLYFFCVDNSLWYPYDMLPYHYKGLQFCDPVFTSSRRMQSLGRSVVCQ
jgi:hypothetical protein